MTPQEQAQCMDFWRKACPDAFMYQDAQEALKRSREQGYTVQIGGPPYDPSNSTVTTLELA